jgi:hypothetical protein
MRLAKVPYVSLFYPYFNWKRPSGQTHVSTSELFHSTNTVRAGDHWRETKAPT